MHGKVMNMNNHTKHWSAHPSLYIIVLITAVRGWYQLASFFCVKNDVFMQLLRSQWLRLTKSHCLESVLNFFVKLMEEPLAG